MASAGRKASAFRGHPCGRLHRGPRFRKVRGIPTVTDHISEEPSEGVFYVVRLPHGWQLCSFRFDEYGAIGLPDCWVQVLEPFLTIWLDHFNRADADSFPQRHAALEGELGQLVAGYDTFPRGEVFRANGRKRFVVRHGGELARTMQVPRREIEAAFGIEGLATWVEDTTHVSDHRSAQRLRSLLSIAEKWEDR